MRPFVSTNDSIQKLVEDDRIQALSGIELLPAPKIGGIRAAVEFAYMEGLHCKHPEMYQLSAIGDDIDDALDRLGKMLDDWIVLHDIDIPSLFRDENEQVWRERRIGTRTAK